MSKMYTGASTSLDGYIAGPAGTGFEHLFEWYGNLQVEVPTTHPEMTLRMTRSAPSMDGRLAAVPATWSPRYPIVARVRRRPGPAR